jgi:hypothetical protein
VGWPVGRAAVALRHPIQHRGSGGGSQTGDVVAVLEGHGHSVQRAEHLAAGQRGVGRLRLPACLLGVERDDRVKRPVVCGDPLEVRLQRLDGFPPGDPGGEPVRSAA